ncbi:hypothetical protein [Paenibacillus sp. 7523-1]|uniref:hypothetical protein n=1 Tax=Paenibacillus sp. 7523-1 TaxID=2022550 RepID=UPI000BA542B1|nr:hypothetical protein [Paenibacillus sp. 7523-1]PAD31883.1 hypothetical protein CHH60_08710 [Paenibacillus sp. 7523-1]
MTSMLSNAKLSYIVICEEAQMINTGPGEMRTVIVQPILKQIVPFVPTQITFNVVVGLFLEKVQAFKIGFFLYAPSGEQIYGHEEVSAYNPDANLTNPTVQLGFGLKNVIIKEEGIFTFKVSYDGEEIGEQVFRIEKQVN